MQMPLVVVVLLDGSQGVSGTKKSVPLSHRRSEEDEDEVPLELHSGNRSVPEITI